VNVENKYLKNLDPVWKYEDEEWNLYSNLGIKMTTSSKSNADNDMFYKNTTNFSKGTIIFTP